VLRYVACVWNDKDVEAREGARLLRDRLSSKAADWTCAVCMPGLFVFYTGVTSCNEVTLLRAGVSGVVLGRLFRSRTSGPPGACANLASEDVDRIVSSAGRHLIEHYWGRYVAFLHDAEIQRTSIIRDPSSGLRCLTTQLGRVRVFWSWMDDALAL